jgi:tetratricopeptide (TPR) repeat protein
VLLVSEAARQLAAASDIDEIYRSSLKVLAEQQYNRLDQTLDITGKISELNLVYLMRKESRRELSIGQQKPVSSSPGGTTTVDQTAVSAAPGPTSPLVTTESLVTAYLRRGQEFESKKDYPKAIQELRDAIKIAPSNSDCHSQLGLVYLKTNQPTMAKIHFNKALELNPQNTVALDGKRQLEQADKASSTASKGVVKGGKPTPKGNQAESSRSGLFGLFGGKKK